MIRRPPRSTLSSSSAASDVYKRQPPFASREEHCVTPSQPGQPEPTVPLASQYGTCGGKAAYARKTSTGSWQVKVHDPTNLLAGHDGWVLLGEGWPTLGDACAATGLSLSLIHISEPTRLGM